MVQEQTTKMSTAPSVEETLWVAFEKSGTPPVMFSLYTQLVTDVILGIRPYTELRTNLIRIARVPERVVDQLLEDISSVFSKTVMLRDEHTSITPKQVSILPKTTVPREGLQAEPIAGPKPLTREEVLNSLAPKRTMPEDVASAQNTTPPLRAFGGYHPGTKETDTPR